MSTPVALSEFLPVHKASDSDKKDIILIALDGSSESHHAFEWALSHYLNAEKHILYLISVAKTIQNPLYYSGMASKLIFFHVLFICSLLFLIASF